MTNTSLFLLLFRRARDGLSMEVLQVELLAIDVSGALVSHQIAEDGLIDVSVERTSGIDVDVVALRVVNRADGDAIRQHLSANLGHLTSVELQSALRQVQMHLLSLFVAPREILTIGDVLSVELDVTVFVNKDLVTTRSLGANDTHHASALIAPRTILGVDHNAVTGEHAVVSTNLALVGIVHNLSIANRSLEVRIAPNALVALREEELILLLVSLMRVRTMTLGGLLMLSRVRSAMTTRD